MIGDRFANYQITGDYYVGLPVQLPGKGTKEGLINRWIRGGVFSSAREGKRDKRGPRGC